MKVFVARAPEAPEPDDFHFALDGELVMLPATICCEPDECGCGRSMSGVVSARATTSFAVTDLDMTVTEYVDALRDGMRRQGWWNDEADDQWLLADAVGLYQAAAEWEPDTPLRIRGGRVMTRMPQPRPQPPRPQGGPGR